MTPETNVRSKNSAVEEFAVIAVYKAPRTGWCKTTSV